MLPMGCQADPDSFQMAFLQSTPEYPHPLLQSLGASEREWMLQGYYIRPFWAFQQGWERFLARGSNSTYEFLSPGGRICLANSSSYFLLKDELAPGWWGTSKWELVALGECKKDTTLAPAFCASAQTTNFGWDRGLVSLQRGMCEAGCVLQTSSKRLGEQVPSAPHLRKTWVWKAYMKHMMSLI